MTIGGPQDYLAHIQAAHRSANRCSRCLFDATTPAIRFDTAGVCNYCHAADTLSAMHPTGAEGQRHLERIATEIRREGRRKPFDVVVGVSGGCDSTYLLTKALDLGLRPLAVHFDNTWNSDIATQNIYNCLSRLGVELYTHVVDNAVYDDILRAFLLSGVIDIETPTDIGLATVLYQACEKYGIRYQFEGHSFRTEGVAPIGWFYIDGKYVESVVRRFGNYRAHHLRTFPNLSFARFMRFTLLRRIRKIRPLYHLDYNKQEVKSQLQRDLGWQWYGGHHLENRFTAFLHSYYAPRRFLLDTRVIGYSALVRSGQLDRTHALELLQEPFHFDPGVLELVKKRLGFGDAEFEELFSQPTRTWREFRTYKQRFERLRPMFWLLMKMDLVPKSFYMKYTARGDLDASLDGPDRSTGRAH